MAKLYSDSQHNWLWSLYLLNLLLLPGLAAAVAMMLLWRYGVNANGKRVLYAFMLCFFGYFSSLIG